MSRPNTFRWSVLGACWLALVFVVHPAWAKAQSSEPDASAEPADVVSDLAEHVTLPALPSGFVERHIGEVTWAFHTSSSQIARDLELSFAANFRKVTSELGQNVSEALTIRIARGPDEMQRLAPIGSPPPAYAVGVAYPTLGLIILSVVTPESWFPPDIGAVLTHELSHIALHRAVKGHAVPLWFTEGLATQQAGEQRMARVRTLWEAAVAGDVLPLALVSQRFPARAHAVNLAYAQSADFVRHMQQSSVDTQRLPRLIVKLGEGLPFETAVLSAYRLDLASLERDWRQGLGERFRLLPLVLTGTVLWAGIALLAVVAFVRRRHQHHDKLARWEQEEAEADRQLAAIATTESTSTPSEPRVLHVYALPAARRETGVPTIEHEGERHTLH